MSQLICSSRAGHLASRVRTNGWRDVPGGISKLRWRRCAGSLIQRSTGPTRRSSDGQSVQACNAARVPRDRRSRNPPACRQWQTRERCGTPPRRPPMCDQSDGTYMPRVGACMAPRRAMSTPERRECGRVARPPAANHDDAAVRQPSTASSSSGSSPRAIRRWPFPRCRSRPTHGRKSSRGTQSSERSRGRRDDWNASRSLLVTSAKLTECLSTSASSWLARSSRCRRVGEYCFRARPPRGRGTRCWPDEQ
jgi:hypothetical protein